MHLKLLKLNYSRYKIDLGTAINYSAVFERTANKYANAGSLEPSSHHHKYNIIYRQGSPNYGPRISYNRPYEGR